MPCETETDENLVARYCQVAKMLGTQTRARGLIEFFHFFTDHRVSIRASFRLCLATVTTDRRACIISFERMLPVDNVLAIDRYARKG